MVREDLLGGADVPEGSFIARREAKALLAIAMRQTE